jgi:hypothetical protein
MEEGLSGSRSAARLSLWSLDRSVVDVVKAGRDTTHCTEVTTPLLHETSTGRNRWLQGRIGWWYV